MTDDQVKIYNYVRDNPNTRIDDVIAATKLNRSFVYKFLSSDNFEKKKLREKHYQYMVYSTKEIKISPKFEVPKHHEIHKAFWGIDL